MAKIFFHYKEHSDSEWQNEERAFTRVPAVGEYVALSSSAEWHRVYAVVHCPFEGSAFDAEVYTSPAANAHVTAVKENRPLPFEPLD